MDTQACSDAQWHSFSIAQWANLVCAGKDDSLKHDRNDLTPPPTSEKATITHPLAYKFHIQNVS